MLIFLTVDRKASRLLVPLSLLILAGMPRTCHIGFIEIARLRFKNTVHANIQVIIVTGEFLHAPKYKTQHLISA